MARHLYYVTGFVYVDTMPFLVGHLCSGKNSNEAVAEFLRIEDFNALVDHVRKVY